jgi:hypothetical protein
MAIDIKNGSQYIRSNLPADNGAGQNGDPRASSSYTAGKTKSPPLGDWQTRPVRSDLDVPVHPSSRDVNANPKTIPTKIDRRK